MSYLYLLGIIAVLAGGTGCGGTASDNNPVISTGDSTGTPLVIGDSTETVPVGGDSTIIVPVAEDSTLTPSVEEGAVFSLAFVAGLAPEADIFLLKTDGSEPVNLTQHPARYAGLIWSPDGSKLAFLSSDKASTASSDIVVMDLAGNSQVKLTAQQGNYSYLAWSPDGTQLAFSYQQHIYVMNADGSDMKALTTYPFIDISELDLGPAWSLDGTKIAFIRFASVSSATSASDIFTMDKDGGHLFKLTDQPLSGFPLSGLPILSWSPDGNQLAFSYTLNQSGREMDIFTMAVGGSPLTNLTNSEGRYDDHPVWSPDGRQIAFRSLGSDSGIYVIDEYGSTPINLSLNSIDSLNDFPKWSPDGKKVVYVRYGAQLDIYLAGVSGDEPVNLTDHLFISTKDITFSALYFAWAPR